MAGGEVSLSGFFDQRFAVHDKVVGGDMGSEKEESQSSHKKGQRRLRVDEA